MRHKGAMDDPDWLPDMEEEEDDAGIEPKAKRLKPSSAGSPGPSRDKSPKPGQPKTCTGATATNSAKLIVNQNIDGIANPPLKIASFNIQVFGERKMGKTKVAGILIEILQRYDIILILEIRDSSETALGNLVEDCNEVSPDNPFSFVASDRLGRTHSKEQYGFMFRSKKVEVKATYQFDDGVDDGTDLFQREPFAVRFYSPSTEMEDFAIIATHTDPDEATQEIGALHKVYFSARKRWGLDDILIAGDFNADEGYVSRDDWLKIPLRQDKRFTWLIKDCTDTTTSNTDRAYDRFVVAGEKMTKSVVPGRTNVFQFDKVYDLTYEETRKVSDHYPIEMELCGKVNRTLQHQMSSCLAVTITQHAPVERENDIRRIYRAETGPESAHFTAHVNYDDSRMAEVVAKREDVGDVIAALQEFQKAFPNVVHDGTVEMVRAYLEGSSLFAPPTDPKHPYVYGLAHTTAWNDAAGDASAAADCPKPQCRRGALDVTVSARLIEPLSCVVTVAMRMS